MTIWSNRLAALALMVLTIYRAGPLRLSHLMAAIASASAECTGPRPLADDRFFYFFFTPD